MPLLCNAMLPILAILIASKAFRDYGTIEELLAIGPPEGEMVQLHWKQSIRGLHFFRSMSSRTVVLFTCDMTRRGIVQAGLVATRHLVLDFVTWPHTRLVSSNTSRMPEPEIFGP